MQDFYVYIWLRFHEPIVNKALFLNLINKNVLINPGYIYETRDLHHIRLSYAYASFEELKEGLNILLELSQIKSQENKDLQH